MHVVHEEACPDIGPICAQRDEPPQVHDQRFYIAELRPVLDYGLSEHFSVEAQLPLKLMRATVEYRRLDGTVFEPDYVNIHHRNETLFGLVDPWLSGRTSWPISSLQLSGRLGVSVPLGKTEENPFALGRAGSAHQHVQLGTGTFNPIVALQGAHLAGPVELRAYAQAQWVLYENTYGFRAGDKYGVGILGATPVIGALRASAGVEVAIEQPERWDGRVEQEGNLGRTDVLVGAAVSHRIGGFLWSVGVKVPVYQRLIGSEDHDHGAAQLTYPAIINMELGRSFEMGT